MSIIHTQSMRALVMLFVCFCVFLAGCEVLLRTSVVTPNGPDTEAEPNTSTIQAGVTTRAEIIQQFTDIDSGWNGKRVFFGRWLRSGATVIPPGGQGRPGCDYQGRAVRAWTARNLAVEFNEQGKVVRYQVLSDTEFLDQLPGLLSAEEHLPEPVDRLRPRVPTTTFKINNVLGKKVIDIFAREDIPEDQPAWNGQITPDQIERVSPVRIPCPTALDFRVVIHLKSEIEQELDNGFKKKNRRVKTLRLRANVPTIALLIYFLHTPYISTTQ